MRTESYNGTCCVQQTHGTSSRSQRVNRQKRVSLLRSRVAVSESGWQFCTMFFVCGSPGRPPGAGAFFRGQVGSHGSELLRWDRGVCCFVLAVSAVGLHGPIFETYTVRGGVSGVRRGPRTTSWTCCGRCATQDAQPFGLAVERMVGRAHREGRLGRRTAATPRPHENDEDDDNAESKCCSAVFCPLRCASACPL